MKSEGKQVSNVIKYFLVLVIGLLFGSIITYFLVKNTGNSNVKIIKSNDYNKDFAPLYETYDELTKNYYKDVNKDTLINGAIDGMMKSLGDKHSMFFNEEQKNDFVEDLSGSYYGIGASINTTNDKKVIINTVFDDSPADKAGLKSGDEFINIDGKSCEGQSASEIANNLRSKSKEKATIVIKRDGKELTIEIEKDIVDLLSVSSEVLEKNIGYIAVSIFGEKTYSQFTKAIDKLEKDNIKSLIIDLRGNTGGYLTTVTEMLDVFLDKEKIIYQMRLRDKVTKYNALTNNSKKYKVIILVDENSASASEIMSSAMKEQYKAILVGTKTYGKGTVQDMHDLSNGTLIKYTTQEWLTSLGNSINDKGIEPDYEVKLSDEFKNNPIRENDNQLQKAIELCK